MELCATWRRLAGPSAALTIIVIMVFVGANTSQAESSRQAAASAVVQQIMSAALSRCYSQVNGVRRITFVPATNGEVAQVKAVGDDAVAPLAGYLETTPRDGFTQLFAVKFLVAVGTPSTIPVLKRAFADDQWEVTRVVALCGMFSIEPAAARPYVKMALADRSPLVRQYAQRLSVR